MSTEPDTAAPATVDLLVTGAAEVATPVANGSRAELDIVPGGAIAISDGRIVAVGPEAELRKAYAARRTLDARGGTVIPGLVDAHTHPVFLGTREHEFELRTQGASYVEISREGGGILSTVRGVREASQEELLERLLLRLDRFLELGTTTIEAKSGYGLTLEDEIKSLEVLRAASALHPVRIVPTFLGAHEFPDEARDDRAGHVDRIVEEWLPAIAERGLAEYADIFTEAHVFDLDASRRIMRRAQELGFQLRLHVDQLTALGGAELAAELGAASADHLEFVTPAGIEALASADVSPVLCPIVPLYLRVEQEVPARAMIDAGLAPALSTDFNPGSCYLQSLFEVMSWAALRLGFSAPEALVASSWNAARSVGREREIGSLEPGKRADLVVLDVPNHRYLTYELGRNPVRAVVVDGVVALERETPRVRKPLRTEPLHESR